MEANIQEPSQENQKECSALSQSDKDESGFGDDILSCSLDDKSLINDSELQLTPKQMAKETNSLTDTGKSDNNLSLPGLKKDDSGIYSEKSPNSCLTKESSDGDLSESASESLDGNSDKSVNNGVRFDLSIDADDLSSVNDKDDDKCVHKEHESNEKCSDIVAMEADMIEDNNMAIKDDRNDKMDSTEVFENEGMELTSKCEISGISATCDIDNNDDDDEEDFGQLVRKAIRSKTHVKKLVDYESDSDDSSSGMSADNACGGRQYRKRKPDSDSNDIEEGGDENKSTEDNCRESNSGRPILLRHSPLNENSTENFVEASDLSSDSSDDSHVSGKAKRDSSDSESDDGPPPVSRFGPPKHKWRALRDLRQREFGYPVSKDPSYFRKQVQGSLQMVQRFQLQFKMDHHEGCVNALHFNSSGTLLASGSDDLNIVIWNWIQNRPALIYDSGHRSNVFQAKFMPYSGDCHVVSCARDGQVRLADLSSTGICKATKKIAQHRGAAHKLALELDSPHLLLSAGEDAVTFEIDLRQDKANKLVTTKEKDKKVSIYSIHSNPVNSNEFCLGGRDHFIRVYDKRKINEDVSNGLLKKFAPHHIVETDKDNVKANVTCACYNYNGTEILGTYNDEDIYLFSNLHSDGADFIHRYQGHRNNQTVKGVNFYGPESEFIVSGSDCGHIFLWDKETENIVQYMEGDKGGVINVLEPHPFAPVLATSGLDHDVKIWAPTAERPTNLKGLKKVMKRNAQEREAERSDEGGMIDGSMLWFIMHHLRRNRRQRAREARAANGEPAPDVDSDSDTLSNEDLSTDEESDNDETPRDAISCNPS